MNTLTVVLTILFTPLLVSAMVLIVFGARAVLKARHAVGEDAEGPLHELMRAAYERTEMSKP